MVRKIHVPDATAEIWGALAELMAQQMHDGTFEDTVVILDWDGESPSFGMGVHEDADMFDLDLIEERDHDIARRYAFAGGTGMRVPEAPVINIYYEREDGSIRQESDLNGEANVDALAEFGLDAEYRAIGDTEIDIDDTTYKIMASSAATLDRHHPDLWIVTESIIWDTPPQETAELYNDAIDLPPEKFEDKDSDSATARIRDVSGILDELDKSTSRDALVDALVEAKVESLFGADEEIHETEWSPEERAFLDEMGPFFESESWVNRVSTTRLARRAPDGYDVGIGAHKARKLVKASLILDDDGLVHDALLSGDLYLRPQPTITRGGVLEDLADALVGLDPTDEDELVDVLRGVYEERDVEAPGVGPEAIARAVAKAGADTRPVGEYLSQ